MRNDHKRIALDAEANAVTGCIAQWLETATVWGLWAMVLAFGFAVWRVGK